jgi:RNA polymerase sigma-70 factor (ECF subfamily)
MKFNTALLARPITREEDIDLEVVYDTFLPRIFHFFCYKVGDSDVAEELTAVTFEKAWASRAKYKKGLGQIDAWILGIARHVAGDHFRKFHQEVRLTDSIEIMAPTLVDEDLQHRQDFQIVFRILSGFPERERELVALKYGAGLTNREISRLTGLSESNVGTILFRVIDKVRKEYGQENER